ncbi:unnamed protein product [Mytilus edulis]|uniref:Uncharacterized protein n=1 Tax=Mytilus edulis TaxID=6550 RepID=A0A8S3UJD1_MYTED|nr:unnamed protein product [Mytilus edulis]
MNINLSQIFLNILYALSKLSACPAGKFGKDCLLPCIGNGDGALWHGVQCRDQCNCTVNQICDPVYGCVSCPSGRYGVNCKEECNCTYDAVCDPVTGDCLCPAGRNLFIVVVVLSVSLVCVLLLALTYLLCGRYLKHRLNQNNQNDGNETDIVHEHYNEINHYSEIRDDQLHDIRSSGMIESDHPQSRMQGTSNKEHRYQNNAQLLSNIDMFEEQRPNSYCSLQHIHDDYLNPYCALRFERRVHSCMF